MAVPRRNNQHIRKVSIGKIGCISGKTITIWSWSFSHKRDFYLSAQLTIKEANNKTSEGRMLGLSSLITSSSSRHRIWSFIRININLDLHTSDSLKIGGKQQKWRNWIKHSTNNLTIRYWHWRCQSASSPGCVGAMS